MAENGNWIAALDEIKLVNNRAKAVLPGGEKVLVIQKDGTLYALENRCPHLSCPLDRGALDGFLLQCPCHDWVFDIRTGEFVTAREIKIPVYQAKMELGKIFIRSQA